MVSTNTRSSSITVSQLGSHEWLMNREGSPSLLPSITVLSSTLKRKVWCGFPSSGNGYISSASSGVIRTPVYSATRTPLSIARFANAPRPAMLDLRITNARGVNTCCVSSESSVPGGVGPRRRLRAAGGAGLRFFADLDLLTDFVLEPFFSSSFFVRERLGASGDSTSTSVDDSELRRRVAEDDFDIRRC